MNINICKVTFLLYQLVIFLDIFITYLFLKTKRLQKKKKFLPAGGSWLFFISPSRWIGNKQLFKVGLTENNYIFENNNKSNLKQVLNIRPCCDISPETFSLKLKIEIVGNLMINGKTPVGWCNKCRNRSQVKPYGGAIARKPDIAIHIARNDITNDYYFILQINPNKELVTEMSPSAKIVLSSTFYIMARTISM